MLLRKKAKSTAEEQWAVVIVWMRVAHFKHLSESGHLCKPDVKVAYKEENTNHSMILMANLMLIKMLEELGQPGMEQGSLLTTLGLSISQNCWKYRKKQ